MPPTTLALISIALWATLATLSVQLKAIPPLLLVGIALLLGGLVGLPRWREWRCTAPQLLLGIYGLFGYHLLLFLAFRYAPPIEANLINYLWPLLIVLLSPLFVNGLTLKLLHFVAGALGFAGAALLITGGRFSFDAQYITGYAFALAAAFFWSTYSLASRRYAGSSAVVSLYCIASGLLGVMMHVIIEPRYVPNGAEWLWLIALGLGPMGLAFFTWDAALKKGDARVIGSLSYLTPLLSTMLLVMFGIGKFTLISAMAMVLIISGALLGTFASRRAA